MKQCICVKREALSRFGEFMRVGLEDIADLVGSSGFAVDRVKAEGDDSIKQVCTYCFICDNHGGVLIYRRPSDHGRKELMGRRSIGVGGHVEPSDIKTGSEAESVFTAAAREIAEETGIACSIDQLLFTGVINTDADAGRFHLGLSFGLTVDWKTEIKPSQELEDAVFLRPNKFDIGSLETWSWILYKHVLINDVRKFALIEQAAIDLAWEAYLGKFRSRGSSGGSAY